MFLVTIIFTVILSACGGTAIPVTGSGTTVPTLPTTFVAVVENITGNQWTLSGQTLTVDPGVVSEGPFSIGDFVKVEVVVTQEGTFAVSSIEAPTVQELSTLPRLDNGTINSNNANNNDNANVNSNTNVNSNDNTNNANSNDNTNNTNSNVNNNSNDNNDTNSNDNNSNDNNSNDANSNDNNDNNNDNDNGGNGNENDNDSSGPGSGGNNNGNDNDDNDNG